MAVAVNWANLGLKEECRLPKSSPVQTGDVAGCLTLAGRFCGWLTDCIDTETRGCADVPLAAVGHRVVVRRVA